MPGSTFPKYTPSNYRTGQNANEFFCYGPGLVTLTSNDQTVETRIRPDSYFLCRKIHTIVQQNGQEDKFFTSGAVNAPNPLLRMTDGRLGRTHQSQPISYVTVGGLAASPNILAAPILFEPASVISMQYKNGSGATFGLCYEGEKIYNPDPAWVQKMRSRFWYQYAAVDVTNTSPVTLLLDLKDPEYDFAICKLMSMNIADNRLVIGNAVGRLRIREKGPNNMYWSNIDIADTQFAGIYGWGHGANHISPPVIVPGTSQLEISYKAGAALTLSYLDFVFDGIKFPRGSNLEDWL